VALAIAIEDTHTYLKSDIAAQRLEHFSIMITEGPTAHDRCFEVSPTTIPISVVEICDAKSIK
jgi:hypothetical protein